MCSTGMGSWCFSCAWCVISWELPGLDPAWCGISWELPGLEPAVDDTILPPSMSLRGGSRWAGAGALPFLDVPAVLEGTTEAK